MKKLYKYITAIALMAIVSESFPATAQQLRTYYRGRSGYAVDYSQEGARVKVWRPLTIDWKPDYEISRRYVVAINPMYLFDNGFRADFEMELDRPGNWLQVGLMVYGRKPYTSTYGGWSSRNSCYDEYTHLAGGGASLGYKSVFSRNGWYWMASASFCYYDVTYRGWGYVPYQEEGMTFYEYASMKPNTEFYVPSVTVNIGKNVALGRNVFLDLYAGLGYSRSFYDGMGRHGYSYGLYDDSSYGFGYSGLYFSGGVRLGVLWGGR